MNRLQNKIYGPQKPWVYEGKTVEPLVYEHPTADIKAVWGPTLWQQGHQCFVRGVPVTQLEKAQIDERNIGYARCAFPGGHIMTVNMGNIRIVKVKGNVHAIK